MVNKRQMFKQFNGLLVVIIASSNFALGSDVGSLSCEGGEIDVDPADLQRAEPANRVYRFDDESVFFESVSVPCSSSLVELKEGGKLRFVVCRTTILRKGNKVDIILDFDRIRSQLFEIRVNEKQYRIKQRATTNFQGLCRFVDS